VGDWILDNHPDVGEPGRQHKECESCSVVLEAETFWVETEETDEPDETHPPRVTVSEDEKGEEENYSGEFMFALAANAKWYGGGFCGAPKATLNDGLLEFVLVRKPSYLQLPKLVGVYKSGKHLDGDKYKDIITYTRGTKMEIESDVEIVSTMDGNCVKTRKECFEILPKALRFMVPEGLSMP
jgi:diacylglycerol kinase family enzyme